MWLILKASFLLLRLLLQGLEIKGGRFEALRNSGIDLESSPSVGETAAAAAENQLQQQQLLLSQSVWQLWAVDAQTHERL